MGGRLPPSLEREDTELLPFLLLHDLPDEPWKVKNYNSKSEKYTFRKWEIQFAGSARGALQGWQLRFLEKYTRLTSKSERQLKLERLPPFFDDSETFFFFFLLELVSVCWVVVCFLKLMSHCSSPLEFSSAFSSNSCKSHNVSLSCHEYQVYW